jgi:serine/threonine-protein kinase
LAGISSLLDSALDLPVSERMRWVQSLDDAELSTAKTRLHALVARSCELAHSALLQTLPKLLTRSDANRSLCLAENIEEYRLVHHLGMGAMGVVWLAQDVSGARVALKVGCAGSAASLDNERRLLTMLDHPNIVRLLGHGRLDPGSPYLVLEYVHGESLLDHCGIRKLGRARRIQLFAQLVAAVAHAHERGIVHRDLKPANVMVDEHGQVRLLDFGIGKLLQAPSGEEHDVHLTPAYASPEQLSGAEVAASSDVYSLGVVAYELLTGRRPHGVAGMSRRALRERATSAQVVPPSAICQPDRLDACGWKDLDSVVLRALHHAPERRYASAGELGRSLAPILFKLRALR